MGLWFHGLLGLASFLSILNQITGTVPPPHSLVLKGLSNGLQVCSLHDKNVHLSSTLSSFSLYPSSEFYDFTYDYEAALSTGTTRLLHTWYIG